MSTLEEDCFSLAEWWHISLSEIMKIPYSRRRRMIRDKFELEERRAAAIKSKNK